MTASDPAAAGWHADPNEPRTLRYWDGTGWTPHTAARSHVPNADATGTTIRLAAGLPEPSVEHTTLPLAPGSRAPTGTDAARRLALAGALTAATSLVVACTALGIVLAG
ncbi:hypothetical protein GCM10017608_14800 [Agromyces luteolus]|uniref:DUF2510 domain-containing protein n=1 Tax=Agromyces luteolus TaxID=88373 RepID=UPI001412BC21|nr:DUF2510 domain-containing protein [Agromyces luteolus]GLK27546.1 hypothetical protein GCM10017608_14800 [Agromyces luteolus]